jgi:hypothetical protein
MSERNGDRARFHKDRTRKLRRRQRLAALIARFRKGAADAASTRASSLAMPDEGGPVRSGD